MLIYTQKKIGKKEPLHITGGVVTSSQPTFIPLHMINLFKFMAAKSPPLWSGQFNNTSHNRQ